ncbi:MAG: hypothetical protein QOJ51_3408 [Acidobacteriaceae bacterium]|nr:hypothetical protein [Acidobacteriaceae bacterium]
MITRDDKKERLLKGRGLLKRRGLLKGRGLLSKERQLLWRRARVFHLWRLPLEFTSPTGGRTGFSELPAKSCLGRLLAGNGLEFSGTPRFRGTFRQGFPGRAKLGQHFRHHLARDVGQAEIPPLELEGQLGMVHAQAVQDGRLQVVDRHRIFHHVVTVVVCLSD